MNCEEMARSENYFDIIASVKPAFLKDLTEGVDYCRLEIEEDLAVYYLPKEEIKGYSLQNYGYELIPKIYAPQAEPREEISKEEISKKEILQGRDSAWENGNYLGTLFTIPLRESGILQVQEEPLNLTGINTLIGIIDTGLRFSEASFLDEIGFTRVETFWDQTDQSGESPEGYLIGKEYVQTELQSMIDENEDTRRFDFDGHGTALASVIANASPLAQFAVVKLKTAKRNLLEYYGVESGKNAYSEVELLQAVKYLVEYAKKEQKPMVICIGLGTNYGNHEGEGTLQQYLERSGMKNQIAIVVAAGNETASAHHCQTTENVELRVAEGRGNFLMECWSEVTSRFTLNIRAPGGEMLSGVDARNGITATYEYVFDQTKLFISTALVERGSGKSLIIIRFQNPTPGIWNLQFIGKQDGLKETELDLWLPVDTFLTRPCFFLTPSTSITVTEPGTARKVITVGAYSDENGSISPSSGRGPSTDQKILPDFCAPGENVTTALGLYSGTGIATAFTVAAVSLLLEWAVDRGNIPFISSEAIRNLLIWGAKRENGIQYPNNTWGYGKLNLLGIFEKIAGLEL